MNIHIDISQKNREAVVLILNRILSDEYLLYTKTRNYHWNVIGPHFNDLHKFFEAQYEELDEIFDEVAERSRSLGGHALGSMKEFLDQTRLSEKPGNYPVASEMVGNLLADHETLIRNLRKELKQCGDDYGDEGTADFLTSLMEKHEKMAWMLRSIVS